MIEEWRETIGFPGYLVSNCGRVCSLKRGVLKGHLKHTRGKPHYRSVCIRRDESSKPQNVKIHRLVLEAFIGPCPIGMEGCHNDGDCSNNALTNLRWDTHAANMRDAMTLGTFVSAPGSHPKARETLARKFALRNRNTSLTVIQ